MAKRTQTASEGHGSATEPQRVAALGALLAALSDGEAATAAGVSARTVRRWRTTDARFMAELDEGLAAIKRANIERGAPLLEKAMDVLRAALDGGDVQVALGIFRAVMPTKLEHAGNDGSPIAMVVRFPVNALGGGDKP